MPKLTLKARILILLLTVVSVSLILMSLMSYFKIEELLHQSLDQKAINLATVLSENIGPGVEFQDSAYVVGIVQSVFADTDVMGLRIYDNEGRIVYSRLEGGFFVEYLESCGKAEEIELIHEDNYCILEYPIFSRNKTVGCMWLVVSHDSMMASIRENASFIIGGAVLILAVASLFGLFIVRLAVKPITTFEEAAKRIREGDLDTPIDEAALAKEFSSLGSSFNHMQSELNSAFMEINRVRDKLEFQVAERTAELSWELTERKKAVKAQREVGEQLRATLESTADGILVVNEMGQVINANMRFAEMWRIPKELMVAQDDDKLIEHVLEQLTDPEAFLSKVKELYQTDREDLDTLYFKDDRVFERYSCPLVFDEQIHGRVWSFRDITARVEAEKQEKDLQDKLKRAEKMESLGMLAGGVAHDLNNMLGPVVGYSDLILEEVGPDCKIGRQVKKIGASAQSAADIIQDLLTLARRGRYEMTSTSVNAVVEAYLDSSNFARLIQTNPNVKFKLELDESVSNITGSSPHLGKVILNFAVNAFDAMPGGGELKIKTYQQYLDKLPSGYRGIEHRQYVALSIKDTGVGIAEEDIDKIFEPYYSKKQMGASGTGLGLAIVYGVVKDHNAYYDIFSKVNEGTEFIVYFPASEEIEETQTMVEEKVIKGHEKVLIVDDSKEQREMAGDLISSLGYQVQMAIHGHDALDKLKSDSFDLILLDMIMEKDFDGLDTYREIQKIKPGQKAIIVTGYSATDRVQEMLRLGAGAIIKKPYSRQVIGQAIREELDRVPATTVV